MSMAMLQSNVSRSDIPYERDNEGFGFFQYLEIAWKRKFYLIIPFLVVFLIGFSIAMLWPPTFVSEAKLLVESQQIPTDLVKPTVTAGAKERIQVIEQRVTTREHLLAIMDKQNLFPDQRQKLSRTELFDLMKQSTQIKPIELLQRGRSESVIAVTVSFAHRRPDVATKVANDLVTLILNEDARNRTNRAMETTKFLTREQQRLEAELASVNAKIAQLRVQNPAGVTSNTQPSPLTALKAELAMKSSVYSKSHPEIRRTPSTNRGS